MSKHDKLVRRFRSKPRDFTFDELRRLLGGLGYREDMAGTTSGSRVAFIHGDTGHIIRAHRPHPSNVLRRYQVVLIHDELRNRGAI